ncbi:MAG TPA: hypothetical protein P5307_13445 [Pirellulaceae bacterium]|nr:hypothetical protein [Pirellulaceae bacterium]
MARICNLLGASIGSRILPASPENERGYWEHAGVVKIHDQLLAAFGLRWDSVAALPHRWIESSASALAREQIESLIDADFSESDCFVIKDPRISRFLPLWIQLLSERGIQPFVLVMVRDRTAVVRSLIRRDDMPPEQAKLLWALHLSDAAHAASDQHHSLVSYEDLLRNWRRTIDTLERRMGRDWPTSPDQAKQDIDSFLNPSLSHSPLSSTVNHALEPNPLLRLAEKLITSKTFPSIDRTAEESLRAELSPQLALWGGYILHLADLAQRKQIPAPKVIDPQLLVDLLDIPVSPGRRDVVTVFWRSSNEQFREDACANTHYEDSHGEMLRCVVALPADAKKPFIRIDPANSRGVFRIARILVDGNVLDKEQFPVRTVNGIRLKEREGEFLRFLSNHKDPHFEIDLRTREKEAGTSSISRIEIQFCRDSLSASILERITRIESILDERQN